MEGLAAFVRLGDRIEVGGPEIGLRAEVTGFHERHVRAMALGPVARVGLGTEARPAAGAAGRAGLAVHEGWLGRVVDPLGQPVDGKGALPRGPGRPTRVPAPAPATRARLGPRMGLGVRALDLFATCRAGQRLGVFAGSGVGKSTLLAMLARQAACDVVVLGLVDERGREVREFIEDDLGPALARSVVVVATSDQSPLLRREAAYAALTVAEHFRDAGRSVLLLMAA